MVSTISFSGKVKIYLFITVLTILLLISGGRLVSSDEVSMFLTVESIVSEGSLSIPIENAPNSTTLNGKSYTWYEIGNIIAGIPLFIIGKITSIMIPLSEPYKYLMPRIAVSYTNVFIGAWIAVLFFTLCQKFEISVRISILMALILLFSTFLLPYFKMYLREPILTLCLISSILYLGTGSYQSLNNRSLLISGLFLGYGILTKLSFAVNLVPIIVYLFFQNQNEVFGKRLNRIFIFLIPIILVGFAGTMLYNYLRFGNPFNSGYAGGTAFTTPIYVGLFGLVFSPGKGIIWFAPILFLLIPSLNFFKDNFKLETYLFLGLFIMNLLLSSMYVAWGGDGSWGPRYLAPYLPLLLLPIGLFIDRSTMIIKRTATVLAIVGVIVQFGGISIYAGAYLREIGEYPYQKGFDDPEFLYKAHFIPNYSPIIGHWRMFTRNLSEHLDGKLPSLQFSSQTINDRLPINQNEKLNLHRTIDFWFTYALYANVSPKIIITLLMISIIMCIVFLFMLKKAITFHS